MPRIQSFFLIGALFLALVLIPSALYSQTAGTGTITGTVIDPSGAAIADATVTVTDLATNASRVATTNAEGRYIFPNILPGTYNVTVNKTGFRLAKFSNQVVNVGSALTLNVSLELGAANQTVEVTATNAELQTMNATVGNTITGIALDSLPSLSRDATTFVTLQPGVAPDGSVAGAVMDQNSFQLDGGQNTNDMDGSMNIYTPSFAGDVTGGLITGEVTANPGGGPTGVLPTPIDSVEEFKVSTTNQTADFNSSAGSQVSLVTRRGGNAWHGTVYEYYLDNNFNGNTFDNNANGVKLPSFHYNRFGGAVGGPIVPKSILGGKTYLFANYQGFRWPNSTTVLRAVPSAAMRAGILRLGSGCDAADLGNCTVYNLNPTPTVDPVTGATIPGSTLDPRSLGINPLVSQMWSKYMPLSNGASCGVLSRCDGVNVQAFSANMAIPQRDNFGVVRLDHDFGAKWHFMSTYRYYHLVRATTSQIDIGGFFSGDTLGMPASTSSRPQVPWFYVAGLTTNISTNVTNDFHYSFLRNYWAWGDSGAPPQIAGLGAALEPFGESSTNVLSPYNVNTQSIRTRFWDGKDNMIRDDVSWLKGSHFFQFGGTYQRNWNYHQRTDNGGGINNTPVYQLGPTGNPIDMSAYTPAAVAAAKQSAPWSRDYSIVLGMVGISQIAYTRSGSDLALNPPLTPAFDKSTIPYYNVYFSDSWRVKPTFTLTYGLGWTLEMPPVEQNGKQVELVDQSGQPIAVESYIKQRENAALQGQVYNPEVGFALVGNTANGLKYPYQPFYGSFSPRVAAAWNPNFDDGFLGKAIGRGKTVVRGGFSIIYGRLNGVDLVLVPLLGTGLIQPVQCFGANRNGTCGAAGSTNPTSAFRVGTDGLVAPLPAAGQTLPQPDFPGLNAIAAGAGEALDPNFRPNQSDQFDLTIQRQLSPKINLELGYIGRRITHEYQPVNINSVPYMMTLGGQRFDKAYAAVVMQFCGGNAGLAGGGCARIPSAVTPQPFFETALAGTGYCTGFSSCTAALVAKEGGANGNVSTQNVWSLWSDLDNGGFNFPRTMMNTPIAGSAFGAQGQLTSGVGVNASIGHGNYNALFATLKIADWHGLTLQSNFTWGKALGTGAVVQATSEFTVEDPFDLNRGYGPQPFDRKFVYNVFAVYEPPVFKGQHGVVGRILGGWSFAPILAMGSGLPLGVFTSSFNPNIGIGGQSFGEADAVNFASFEQAVRMCPNNFGSSRNNNMPTAGGFGTNGFVDANGNAPGLFSNPAAAYSCFRNPILGLDGQNGGTGILRGLPFWNVDFQVRKNIHITERFSAEFQTVFTNVFNHVQLFDPLLVMGDQADWGALPGQVNTPRQMEFGLRVRF